MSGKAAGSGVVVAGGRTAMEPEDYQALLEKYDDSAHAERPPDLDLQGVFTRFEAFVSDLKNVVGMPLETDQGGDPTSYHSEVALPSRAFPAVVLRFSNFGELAAVTDEMNVSKKTLGLVKALLSHHGYTYIPRQVLSRPYAGKNPVIEGTWWDRYFEYI